MASTELSQETYYILLKFSKMLNQEWELQISLNSIVQVGLFLRVTQVQKLIRYQTKVFSSKQFISIPVTFDNHRSALQISMWLKDHKSSYKFPVFDPSIFRKWPLIATTLLEFSSMQYIIYAIVYVFIFIEYFQNLIWLIKELLRANVIGTDMVIWNLMRHIAGVDVAAKNIWLADTLMELLIDQR